MTQEIMKLSVSIKASKLKNVAGAFKGQSDPFAVVTLLGNHRGDKPRIIGKTEVIKNNLNPDWVTAFTIDYELGEPANLLIKIFDEVSKGDNKPMGSAVFEIGSVLGSKGSTKAKRMQGGKGTLFLRVEKAKSCGTLKLKMSGVKLTNTDGMFSKSDPFYEFIKKDYGLRGTEWNVTHRSSYVKNDLNPNWAMEDIDLALLCGGNLDERLVLNIYDHEKSGTHELMGEIETTVNGLIAAKQSGKGFPLKRKGKNKGTIIVHTAEVSSGGNDEDSALAKSMSNVHIAPTAPPMRSVTPAGNHTFTDYIRGGCEINLNVAIDFTGSNGDPRKPGTLHYIHPDGQLNDYQQAIKSIGTVLAKYDHDKKFPVVGFGAKFGGTVRHCFQCGPQEEVEGVDGILDAYRKTFSSGLVMSGPTVFTEVIQTAAARANSSQEEAMKEGKQKYSVLLILTDGAVSDVQATARCIDAIDAAPLSIVIVGIGQADFSSMQFLDDKAGDIDISQFVEFDKHKNRSDGLTSATLDEIPSQLERYFLSHKIAPNPPVNVGEEEINVAPEEEEFDLTIDFGDGGDPVGVSGGNGGVYVPPY
jgi:hypothetical protein